MSLFPTRNIGLELAAILMIFTAQAWNLAFSFYNSLKTLPDSLRDACKVAGWRASRRSEEHTSELQSQSNLVCRLLLEKKKQRCSWGLAAQQPLAMRPSPRCKPLAGTARPMASSGPVSHCFQTDLPPRHVHRRSACYAL